MDPLIPKWGSHAAAFPLLGNKFWLLSLSPLQTSVSVKFKHNACLSIPLGWHQPVGSKLLAKPARKNYCLSLISLGNSAKKLILAITCGLELPLGECSVALKLCMPKCSLVCCSHCTFAVTFLLGPVGKQAFLQLLCGWTVTAESLAGGSQGLIASGFTCWFFWGVDNWSPERDRDHTSI